MCCLFTYFSTNLDIIFRPLFKLKVNIALALCIFMPIRPKDDATSYSCLCFNPLFAVMEIHLQVLPVGIASCYWKCNFLANYWIFNDIPSLSQHHFPLIFFFFIFQVYKIRVKKHIIHEYNFFVGFCRIIDIRNKHFSIVFCCDGQ